MEYEQAQKKDTAHLEVAEKMAHTILSEHGPTEAAECVSAIYRVVHQELSKRAEAEHMQLETTTRAINDLNGMLDPKPDGR